jgi:hypothetical protein
VVLVRSRLQPVTGSRGVMRLFACLVVGLSGLLAGCGASTVVVAPTPSPTPFTPTPIACPRTSQPAQFAKWPAPVPAALPRPPTATRPVRAYHSFRLTVFTFKTSLSLRDAVLFVLNKLPSAGFVIGRGDAEPGQADAPFTGGGIYGQIRVNFVQPCRTQWLVAIGAPTNGGSPLLTPVTPSASPVPLSSFGFGG